MLTQEQMDTLIENAGIPMTYLTFEEPQTAPYAAVLIEESHNVDSDHSTLDSSYSAWSIELYYRSHLDRVAFEDWLDRQGIVWDRPYGESYIQDEAIWEAVYLV